MRTTYIAAVFVAAQAAAFEWKDVMTAVQMMGGAFKAAREYQQNFNMHDIKLTTRHDSRRTIEKFAHRRVKPLTKEQRHLAVQAHHNIMDRRQRMGLPLVGAAAGPKVGQSYENLSSFSGNFLNLLTGMQYNSGATDSRCFDSAESIIIGFNTFSDIAAKLYIPAYWAELQVQFQDTSALSSAVFVDCNLDKMFTTLTHLATSEGLSELSGRVVGAAFFELSKCANARGNPELTGSEKSKIYGKCASVLLNFTI